MFYTRFGNHKMDGYGDLPAIANGKLENEHPV